MHTSIVEIEDVGLEGETWRGGIGDSAGNPPDEVRVEFRSILSAEAGVVLAAASTEINCKMTMTWKRLRG